MFKRIMNKKLLIFPFAALIVLGFVFGFNYEILDDYVRWYIPLNQINQTAIYYNGQHVNVYDGVLTPTVSNVTYIDENTLEITFNKNDFVFGDYEIPNEFELVKQVKLGDKFIATCYGDKVFHIDIFHLIMYK